MPPPKQRDVSSWHEMRPRSCADQCPELGVERTQRGRRFWAVHDPEADITQIEIPQCSGCCRAKMAYQRAL
jgi:hypothetical protein